MLANPLESGFGFVKGLLLFEGEHAREEDTSRGDLSYNASMNAGKMSILLALVLAMAGCRPDQTPKINSLLSEAKNLGLPVELSQLSSPQPQDKDNAALDFGPGSPLKDGFSNVPRLMDFRLSLHTEKSKEDVANWLATNHDLMNRLDQALAKKDCWVSSENPDGTPNFVPGATQFKGVMRALSYRLLGQPWPAARQDMKRMAKLSQWAAQDHYLIGLLVAAAVDAMRMSTALHFASSGGVNATQIREMKSALATARPLPPFSKYAYGDLCFGLWTALNPNGLRAPVDPVYGHIEKKEYPPIVKSGIPREAKDQEQFLRILETMVHYANVLRKEKSEAKAFNALAAFQEKAAKTEDERVSAGIMKSTYDAWRKCVAMRKAGEAFLELLAIKKESGTFPANFEMKAYEVASVELKYRSTKGGFEIDASGLQFPFTLAYPWQMKSVEKP